MMLLMTGAFTSTNALFLLLFACRCAERPPNPPSPPAAYVANEMCRYRNLVLSFTTSTRVYTVIKPDKAYRITLNTSYTKNVKGNMDYFISSISAALALVFQVPSPAGGNMPNGTVYVMSVYNSTWPVANQGMYLAMDYTVVAVSYTHLTLPTIYSV